MNINTSLAGCLAICRAGCASLGKGKGLWPAAKVDLTRYMGSWRIIACMDNPVERGFVDAVETYELRPQGRIGVHFAWRKDSFDAPVKTHDFTGRVTADGTNARWKMRLFPIFTASYIIIHVSPDYSTAAVAHPSRKFGWILARNRTLPEATYQELIQLFERQGYDTSQFIRIPQEREGSATLEPAPSVH